jgi:hypothetical protein
MSSTILAHARSVSGRLSTWTWPLRMAPSTDAIVGDPSIREHVVPNCRTT